MRNRVPRAARLVTTAAVLLVAGCSSDGDDSAAPAQDRTASATASGPPAAQAARLDLTGKNTMLQIDAQALQSLRRVGLQLSAVPPATSTAVGERQQITIPVTSGQVRILPAGSGSELRGRVAHEGGLRFTVGGKSADVTDLVVDFGDQRLTGVVAGIRLPLLSVAMSSAAVSRDGANVTVTGVPAGVETGAAKAVGAALGKQLPDLLRLGNLRFNLTGQP